MIIFFQIITLIFSVIVHEVAHGRMALRLGDTTARDLGRLTLNPLRHIDPVGSVLLPLILIAFQSPVLFGWAKPVPYNPYNLRDPKKGAALIAAAGPLSNIAIAAVFGLFLRFAPGILEEGTAVNFLALASIVIFINLIIAIFNLIPIPPLDGSKLLFAALPSRFQALERFLTQYGFIFLLVLLFSPFFSTILSAPVFWLYRLLIGPVGSGLL